MNVIKGWFRGVLGARRCKAREIEGIDTSSSKAQGLVSMRIRRTDGYRVSVTLEPEKAKRLAEALLSGVEFLETATGDNEEMFRTRCGGRR